VCFSVCYEFGSDVCLSKRMVTWDPEDFIMLLLLLYLDPSTPSDVRRDISLAVEDIIISVAQLDPSEQTKVRLSYARQ